MRAAMGDYMGLAAAIGAPHISIEQVQNFADDRQSSRTDRVLASLPLLRRTRRRRDAPQNAGAARAFIPCAGERRREDFRCGIHRGSGEPDGGSGQY
jgi:hypothetical protein